MYTFYCLIQGMTFEESLKYVIKMGGDTDTNACIVGGLIGALNGQEKIQSHLIDKMLGWKWDD